MRWHFATPWPRGVVYVECRALSIGPSRKQYYETIYHPQGDCRVLL